MIVRRIDNTLQRDVLVVTANTKSAPNATTATSFPASKKHLARRGLRSCALVGRLREEMRPAVTVTNYSEPKTFTTKHGTRG